VTGPKNCDKTGTVATKVKDCGTDVCKDGKCHTPICKVGVTECVDTAKYRTCTDSGLKWKAGTCGSQTACASGVCKKVICKPGALRCKDIKIIQTCNKSGTAWNGTTDCTKSKLWCAEGKCVKQVCPPYEKVCDGAKWKLCAKDGLGFVGETLCDDGDACTANLCEKGVCKYGPKKDCDDKQPCTVDACSASTGKCENKPTTAACDDGNACTLGENCATGKCSAVDAVIVETLSGTSQGFTDGPANKARFYRPRGMAVDSKGYVFVADYQNHRVRRVAPDGTAVLWAGIGSASFYDGPWNSARFYYPSDVTLVGGSVYVADYQNGRIRRIDGSRNVTTFAGAGNGYADGTGTAARFNRPEGVEADKAGNLWVADTFNHRIRLVSSARKVTTVAGSKPGYADGPGYVAQFRYPRGIAVGGDGNVWVADDQNYRIRRVSPTGVVTTVAGNGSKTSYNYVDGKGAGVTVGPTYSIAALPGGDAIFPTQVGHTLRRIKPDGTVSTIAGIKGKHGLHDGTATTARFYYPWGIATDAAGSIYVGGQYSHRIRKLYPATKTCNDANPCTVDLCNTKTGACTNTPVKTGTKCDDGSKCTTDETCDKAGKCLAVATKTKTCDDKNQCTHNICDPATSKCSNPQHTDKCDDGDGCTVGDACEAGTCHPGKGLMSTLAGIGKGFADGPAGDARFSTPRGISVMKDGAVVVADELNHRVRSIVGGKVSTIAGSGTAGYRDGAGPQAQFNYPSDTQTTLAGGVYVSERLGHRIRHIAPSGWVRTHAGSGTAGYQDGPGSSAQFNTPNGIALDRVGRIFVADSNNHRIRRVQTNGVVTTVAGSGQKAYLDGAATSAAFYSPVDVVVDANLDVLVADTNNHRIRRISGKTVSTVAGSGQKGFQDGAASSARINTPWSIALDPWGGLLITSHSYHRVRRLHDGQVTTIAGTGGAGSTDGQALKATLHTPMGLAVGPDGAVFITDTGSHRVRKLVGGKRFCNDRSPCTTDKCDSKTAKCVFTALKTGTACNDGSACTTGDKCDTAGKCLGAKKSCSDGNVCTTDWCNAYTAQCVHDDADLPCDDGSKCTSAERCHKGKCQAVRGHITTFSGGPSGFQDGNIDTAKYNAPMHIAVGGGGVLYVTDHSNHRVRKVANKLVTTVAGAGKAGYLDGAGSSAQFAYPTGIIARADGSLLIADRNNWRLRAIAKDGTVTTVAGSGTKGYQDGFPTSAKLGDIYDICARPDGVIALADTTYHRVRSLEKNGNIGTLAGSGSSGHQDGPVASAKFASPRGVACGAGGSIYVADTSGHRIRRVRAGVVTSIAGSGSAAFTDGIGSAAAFHTPNDVAVNRLGEIYVADSVNRRLRLISPKGQVTTVAGNGTDAVADGFGFAASFRYVSGLAMTASGDVLIADTAGHQLRKLTEPRVLCSDGKLCTTDTCDTKTGACSYPKTKDGGACDDPTKPCLSAMTCLGGVCQGGEDTGCDDGNPCSLDKCDAKTGACSYTPNPGEPGCKAVRRVFLTSQKWPGAVGPYLEGAHAKCQTAADNAKLGGTWLAWLGGRTTKGQHWAPANTFNRSTVPYVRMDGKPVAKNWSDIADGSLSAAINVTEHKQVAPKDTGGAYCKGRTRVWTNVNANGGISTTAYHYQCYYWTQNSSSRRGYTGDANLTTVHWTFTKCAERCNIAARLYCFEQTDHYTK